MLGLMDTKDDIKGSANSVNSDSGDASAGLTGVLTIIFHAMVSHVIAIHSQIVSHSSKRVSRIPARAKASSTGSTSQI